MALSKYDLGRSEKWTRAQVGRYVINSSPLGELIPYLSDLAKKADPKCDPMSHAYLDINYDIDDSVGCWVNVRRPETDDEWHTRVENLRQAEAERNKQKRQQAKARKDADYKEFLRLKAKYEK